MGKDTPTDPKAKTPNDKDKDATAKKKAADVPEMSDEDIKLKEELDLLAGTITEGTDDLQKTALDTISTLIRDSIGTMTSIPKPLKFLKEHYDSLKRAHREGSQTNKTQLADVLSVLAMTMAAPDSGESLSYRLEGSTDIALWGHEYIRNLCAEVVQRWTSLLEEGKDHEFLLPLVSDIVKYHMAHNAESEAVDLLIEVDKLEDLHVHITEQNWRRVALYLMSCAQYLPPDEAVQVRHICVRALLGQNQTCEALRVAMMLNDRALATSILTDEKDRSVQKQMALMLGSQQMFLQLEDDELNTLMNNERLSTDFITLATELDVLEPKLPGDVFKTSSSRDAPQHDSARLNLASTFANAFVNAGFCNDKLMMVQDPNATVQGNQSSWVFKNKDHGMLSAVASVGMLMMWNVDDGLAGIDKYMYTDNENITAGAFLACGLVNASVRNDCDPALALLGERTEDKSALIRSSAMLGLGIAYASSAREDIMELLLPSLDVSLPMDVICIGCLSLGLVFAGSSNADVAENLLQCMMSVPTINLSHPLTRFMCLAIGLVFLGKGNQADLTIEACAALDPSISELCTVIIRICAFATSGDVLQVQHLLEVAGRHPPKKEEADTDGATDAAGGAAPGATGGAPGAPKAPKADTQQPRGAAGAPGAAEPAKQEEDKNFSRVVEAAVMGIGVVAMGEDIGSQMATRMVNHIIQFGDTAARRAVPLCLAMLSTSNAEYRVEVMETLQKLCHDQDTETSLAAILSLGLVGAGTNNSRIAESLRQLAHYYEREPNQVFAVRLAQGLLHMGKGLISLSPFHSDRSLVRPTALSALLVVGLAALDFKNIILQKYHWLLYTIALAMHPRMLVCLDEEMKPVHVSVRVGQAVDTVGQAGNPKTITAFQTHTTPVLIGYGERAELANDDHVSLTPTLEGFVIVKPSKPADS